jgi:hypothetical protein
MATHLGTMLIALALGALAAPSHAAPPQTRAAYDACVARVEASVSQAEVGMAGVTGAIRQRCGTPPAREPSAVTGIVGMHPYDVVRAKAWRPKFERLLKAKYRSFVHSLTVASETELDGPWVTGAGIAPHSGGTDEAAFAINVRTGEVFAAMLEDGRTVTGFGFRGGWTKAPPPLQDWAQARERLAPP